MSVQLEKTDKKLRKLHLIALLVVLAFVCLVGNLPAVMVQYNFSGMAPVTTPAPTPLPQTISISAPTNGASLNSNTRVADNNSPAACTGNTAWYSVLYLDGLYVTDCNFYVANNPATGCTILVGSLALGAHTVEIRAHTINAPVGNECAKSQTVNFTVTVPSPTASPSATPSSTPTPPFTGSTTPMQNAGEPGIYGATTTAAYSLDGQNFINNQLLSDSQAAALVVGLPTLPLSRIETGANGAGHASINTTGDRYYQSQTTANYTAELNNWKAAQNTWPADVAARVDGAIPITNPTFAQINAWAAFKWGVNPTYGLGDSCQEGHFDINNPGDVNSCSDTGPDMWGGCSTGPEQIADRGSNHGWPGLLSNNLAAESLPFAMDFYYMHVYAEWNGLFNNFGHVGFHDIINIIQYWCGSPAACPNYYQNMLNNVSNKCWISQAYGGTTISTAPAVGTTIPAP